MTEQIYISPNSGTLATRGENEFLSKMVRGSWGLLFICFIYQLFFFPELTNTMMVAAVALAWFILVKFFLTRELLWNFPLSSFLIIGFTATQFYFPLIFTSLEGKPITYNLDLPEKVFFHSLAALLTLTLAHGFYRLLSKLSYKRSYSVLSKAGFFTPPTENQLWLMGIIGLAATVYVFISAPDVGREVTGPASGKIMQGLVPFSYAPFFIPFARLYGSTEVPSKRLMSKLLIFTVLLFAISIARNSTGAFMLGFTAVGFAYFLGLLLGMFKIKILSWKNVALGVLAIWLVVGPLADLRTAMVIVRGDREKIPAEELLNLTLEAYGDKEAIAAYRAEDQGDVVDSDWDERYLDNVLTARFANLKYNDASLGLAEIVKEYDPDMLQYSVDYILGAFPDPVLKTLGIDVDKDQAYSVSIGDYLYLTSGGYGFVSGFRTGHFAGTGMATFGWWYLFILGIGMVPVFFIFDKFSRKVNSPSDSEQPHVSQLQFSFCGMLALNSIFQFLPFESVITIANFFIRGWIQLLFLYFLMFHFTRFFNGSFFKRLKF